MSQRELSRIFFLGWLVCVMAGMAFGQGVYEAWVARYNGPGNGNDQVKALAVDDSGNVYVTGSNFGGLTAYDYNYLTIKYTPAGYAVWKAGYRSEWWERDTAYALAVDHNHNVYVTGTSYGDELTFLDYATIKYAPNGDTLWVRRYNGPGNDVDGARALSVDEYGNVYVTGVSHGGYPTNYDYATIKYSPNGDTLWVRRYNGPGNGKDVATAIAVDTAGNVYVTGWSYGIGSDFDYATIKYSPNGDTLWVRRYNTLASNLDDQAYALVVDDSGNVYVTGRTWGRGGSSYNYTTVKYAPDGSVVWENDYYGPGNGNDEAYALALDHTGNVYITGKSLGLGTGYDYATIKYAPNGDILWVRRYPEGGDLDDAANALAVDDSGNVYVTGFTSGFYVGANYTTIKYLPNGDTAWVRSYNGPGNSEDDALALAVDSPGNVYVTGRSWVAGNLFDYATVKYSPCSAIPGDVNGTGGITLTDIIHLINFYFDKDKPPCSGSDPGNCWEPNPVCRADVDGTPGTAITDIIYLVNYYFDKDRPATSCIGTDPGNCWTPVANGACCLSVP